MHTKPVAKPFLPTLLLLLLVLTACSSGLEIETPNYELEAQATSNTITVPIAAVSDDAEQRSGGAMRLSDGLLDFSTKNGVRQSVGLRFDKLDIPRGAKVTAAYIKLRAGAYDAGTVKLQVRGEAADDAETFATTKGNLSLRTKTSAVATWTPRTWTRGKVVQTSSLTGVVQQIVDRSGWQRGNAAAFFVTGDGRGERAAFAFGQSAAYAPMLVVSYEAAEEAAPETEPAPAPEAELGSLPDDSLETWNSRLIATISNPQYGTIYDAQYGYVNNESLNPVTQANSGNLYTLGRSFNQYATSLTLAYRKSGDHALMRQLDFLMGLVKDTLGDPNGDGFLNFRYQHTNGAGLYGDDYHEMDEILTHSGIAAMAYALKQSGYSSSAAFWTDYLQNDFEAKWRRRKNKPSGFPFLTKDLMHPYVQWIRYHYYMGKLTGDSSYTREAQRMAGVVRGNMKVTSTPSGTGYEWAHRVQLSGSGGLLGCQPMVYVKNTTQALTDLATQDSRLFDSTFMQKVANTMAFKAWKNTEGTQLANDICGGGTYSSLYHAASHPYTMLAAWDNSGTLKEIAIRTYYATEQNREASPRVYNLPAMMVFTLGQ